MWILLGLLIPLLGTSIGALLVFFIKDKISNKGEKILFSISSGIMFAASIWSLIIPALEQVDSKFKFVPVSIGFILGISFFYLIDYIENKVNNNDNSLFKMIFAIVLHNIPEGAAVGVVIAAAIVGQVTISSAIILSIGIAIQNIPEGAIISLPLKSKGYSKIKAFIYGVLSGLIEVIFGGITILLTEIVVPILPYFLGFAAAAMIYVVVDELIPKSRDNYKYSTAFFSIGFLTMMVLDVFFG